MTAFVPDPLILALDTPHPGALRVALKGDLDFTTAGELLAAAVAAIEDRAPADLYLDCGGLRICDSSGLAILLTVRRHATAAGARLHLDDRPPVLDRLLELSGTYEHLVGAPAPASSRWSSTQD
ncbi:STAS domain-containing protein [Nonomuraea sp. NPDC050783]|uniref:STAS domain-containing protein n=1 Tax=Nonomuraea sp. NPDC050783 TaxID=3154634 RepID=UPI00346783E6